MVKKLISAAAAAAIVFGFAVAIVFGSEALPQGVFDDLGTEIITVRADTEYTSGFWRFTKNADNTIYISGYTGFDSSITIPATLEGLKVVGIGDNAFENNQNLEEVIIPANVTYIGYEAFKGSSITKITVPATVKTFGYRDQGYGYVFYSTFENCANLKTVVFNAGDIQGYMFRSCTALTTVTLGSTTKMIGDSAFLNCTSLKTINLNNVTSINGYAFEECESLGSVTLGNDLVFLGYRAFALSGLTSVTIPEKAEIGLYVSALGTDSQTFFGCDKLTTATINNNYVGKFEFDNCSALKKVTLGTNIRTIEGNAFSDNEALTTVINKGNPVYIGEYAFGNCPSLKNINLGSSLIFLGDAAFEGDSSLTTMRIPSTVVNFGEWFDKYYTFSGCTNLKNVYIANASMKTDGTYGMFDDVTGFTINTIQDSPAYKYATNNVYSKKTFAAVPSTAVAFNSSNYTLINGETLTLYPEMTPANSTDNYTYISGDTSVAEVNEYGVVTAKKTGLVQIQVTTSSGKKAVCTINVLASGTSSKDVAKKKNIALSTVTIPNASYTGSAITPAATVLFNPTIELVKDVDYTISYTNNVKIGTATATIKGKGNYNGKVKVKFKICPKKTAVKKLTSPKTKQLKVTYGKVAGVTGYQITYSTSSKFTKKTTKSVNAVGTSKTIKELTKGKTYYVKVRTYKTVSGKKYYSDYSAVKKIKVK